MIICNPTEKGKKNQVLGQYKTQAQLDSAWKFFDARNQKVRDMKKSYGMLDGDDFYPNLRIVKIENRT